MDIPENVILEALYSYGYDVTQNKYDGVYNCGCPICREGKSLGKKKRLYYYPKTKSFFCFNCSESWSAYKWIRAVSGCSHEELLEKLHTNDFSRNVLNEVNTKKRIIPTLPHDSINLCDETTHKFYRNNTHFNRAIQYIENRRLDVAVNRCDKFFISFTDKIHKNRLIIPFTNNKNQILFYQSRSIDGSEPKYLGKFGSEKTLFGIDKVDNNLEYIFIFEGPIDSMFVKNGVAIGGLNINEHQKKELSEYPFHRKIWILDNISVVSDEETKRRTTDLLNKSEEVYKWNNRYKDFNEWAISENLKEIDYRLILKNLY